MFRDSPAALPERRHSPVDPKLHELLGAEGTIQLVGIPYDDSVVGRKGCRDGPTGIREAMRFFSNGDPDGASIASARVKDWGEIALPGGTVLETHDAVTAAMQPVLAAGPTIVLGGDHGLSYATVRALAEQTTGTIGIIVIDAHYDMRPYESQPSSGTPFRRILEELDGRIKGEHIVEFGIRPFANDAALGTYAESKGVRTWSARATQASGIHRLIKEVLAQWQDVEHLWLSIDIDGLDQSIASGCSAPGPGGLLHVDAVDAINLVAADPRCRALEIMEVAPKLDPTGLTCRTAASLVAHGVQAFMERN